MKSEMRVVIAFANGTYEYTRLTGLKSVSRTIQSMSNNVLPLYDIICPYGSIIIYDKDKNLYNRAVAKDLLSSITIYSGSDVIGRFISTKNWKYDVFTNVCEIELKGDIIKWQDKTIKKRELTYNATAMDIYTYLKGYSGTHTFSVDSDTEMQTYLTSIVVPYFYLESDNLWNQWVKFCNLTQMLIYQDDEGVIQFTRLQ